MKKMDYIPSDDLFDRISPLVGKLIAAKITEAFRALVNYVNDRLESVLSSRMWRFRYIAFRTKLPIGEVILKESLACVVDEVLIIEKKSSLLLGNASRHGENGADRDVVVAMLSAIMDFIRTSFKKSKKGGEQENLLNGIEFGDSRIIVQESPYFYSAFVVQGAPGIDFLAGSDNLTASIHESFRMKLKKFDGSMYGLEGISPMLEEFIAKMNMVVVPGQGENRNFRKLKIAAGIAAVIFAVWAGLTIRGEILDYRLEKKFYAAASEKIQKFSYDIEADADGDELLITGMVSTPAISEELNKIAAGLPEIKNIDNRTVVADFRTAEKFHKNYEELEQKFNDLQLLLIRQELEKIVIQFPSGVDTMGNSQMLQARRIYEIVKEYPRIHLDIIAFNDPDGGFDINKRLAEGRMSRVGSYLGSLGIESGRIHLTESTLMLYLPIPVTQHTLTGEV
jgi:outer membrane protein OmpA-like peptidoglycan-associated protein